MSLQQIVDRHYREVNSNDYSDVAEVFTADVVTHVPGVGALTGIEPFVAYGQGFHRAFPDGRIHGDRYVESGDLVVVEGRFTGTNTGPLDTPAGQVPATGRTLILPFADLFRVADGKIAEHRVYFDSLGMLAQLGLMPEPTSA
jgi:ketosteroid isomerase-like protein